MGKYLAEISACCRDIAKRGSYMSTSGLDMNIANIDKVREKKEERRQHTLKYYRAIIRNMSNVIAYKSNKGDLKSNLQEMTADEVDSIYTWTVATEAAIKSIQVLILQENSRRKERGR